MYQKIAFVSKCQAQKLSNDAFFMVLRQGYKSKHFFVTKAPHPEDFVGFWKEVYAQSCQAIIMLNKLENVYEVHAHHFYVTWLSSIRVKHDLTNVTVDSLSHINRILIYLTLSLQQRISRPKKK